MRARLRARPLELLAQEVSSYFVDPLLAESRALPEFPIALPVGVRTRGGVPEVSLVEAVSSRIVVQAHFEQGGKRHLLDSAIGLKNHLVQACITLGLFVRHRPHRMAYGAAKRGLTGARLRTIQLFQRRLRAEEADSCLAKRGTPYRMRLMTIHVEVGPDTRALVRELADKTTLHVELGPRTRSLLERVLLPDKESGPAEKLGGLLGRAKD